MAVSIGEIQGQLTLEDKFSKGLDAAGKKMKNLGSSMLPISAAFGAAGIASLKFATDLNASMANVATLIPQSSERVIELKENVQDLAIVTGKSSKDLSEGLFQVISAFGDTAETAQILEINAKAAAAGMASTTDAINLTSAVTKGYGDVSAETIQKASDLAFVTNKLGQTTFPELAASIGKVIPIASAMGVSQEELFAGFATLTGVTGNAAEVSTQYVAVMNALLKPTDSMTVALGELGFASGDAAVEQLGLVGAVRAVIDTTDGGTAAAGELFESVRALPAVFALTSGQADVFDEKLEAMNETAGASIEAFGEVSEGINASGFAFAQLQQKLRGAAEDFGDQLLPIVTKFADEVLPSLLDALVGAIKFFSDLDPTVQKVVVAFGAIVTVSAPLLIALGFITSAFGAMGVSVGLLSSAILPVTAVVTTFFAAFELTSLILDFVPGLRKATTAVVDFGLEITGVTALLDAYNAEAAEGKKIIEGWTEAEWQAFQAHLANQEVLILEASAAGTLGKQVEEVEQKVEAQTDALTKNTRVMFRAKEMTGFYAGGSERLTLTIQGMVDSENERLRIVEEIATTLVSRAAPAQDEFNDLLQDMHDSIENNLPLQAELGNRARKIADDFNGASDSVGFFMKTLSELGDVIIRAIEGGGDVGKAIGAKIGKDLGDELGKQLTASIGGHLGELVGGFLGPLGALAGSFIGGALDELVGGFFTDAEEEVNDLRDAFLLTQGGWEELAAELATATTEDLVGQLFDAETVDEFNAALERINGTLDLQAQAQQALAEATERYGFTIEELGPAMQRQELEAQAGRLLQDFNLLVASGIDINTVIERMGPNILDFVNTSIAAGQAIPEAMRPMIDQLIQSGQLLDENGNAFESAEDAGITFAQTMSEQFKTLIEKIDAMVNALMGIGDTEIPDIPVRVKVKIKWPPNIPDSISIPALATGGIVRKPTVALIGEDGPEAVVPLSQSKGAFGESDDKVLDLLMEIARGISNFPEDVRRAILTAKAFSN